MIKKYNPIQQGVRDLFKNENISIGIIGNKERWYKSPISDEIYDGDSLCAKVKQDYHIVDGKSLEDVGNFFVYGDTFRKVKIGEDPGFIIAYAKSRDLKKPNDKKFWLNLLIGNTSKNEFKKENLNYQLLSDMITMPVLPEVYANDQDNELAITQKIVYPFSMSFENGSRNDLHNWAVDLNKFGISLEKIINNELNSKKVQNYIGSIAPKLGCDFTYDPIFPETRKDICAVRHLAEGGGSGYDTIYLVWKDKENNLKNKELANSHGDGGYLFIDEIKQEKDNIIIDIRNRGNYSFKKQELDE